LQFISQVLLPEVSAEQGHTVDSVSLVMDMTAFKHASYTPAMQKVRGAH
jgi:hypothetical protein